MTIYFAIARNNEKDIPTKYPLPESVSNTNDGRYILLKLHRAPQWYNGEPYWIPVKTNYGFLQAHSQKWLELWCMARAQRFQYTYRLINLHRNVAKNNVEVRHANEKTWDSSHRYDNTLAEAENLHDLDNALHLGYELEEMVKTEPGGHVTLTDRFGTTYDITYDPQRETQPEAWKCTAKLCHNPQAHRAIRTFADMATEHEWDAHTIYDLVHQGKESYHLDITAPVF